MNWTALYQGARKRPLLACGGLCGLAMSIVIGPFSEMSSGVSKELRMNRATIERAQAVILGGASISQAKREMNDALSNSIIPGDKEEDKSASLIRIVERAARDNGLKVNSLSLMRPRKNEDAILLGVRLEVQGDIERLIRTISSMESGWPLLTISSATLRSSESYTPEMVVAEIEIYGVSSWR